MANERSFHHVFLSFKGEMRNSFICFLYDALKAEGFETFMDKEAIGVGDELDSRIREGIRGSMSAIVVFSENYAFSTWCLDELLLILDRKKTSRYFIIPIFYEVKPAGIKHQLGSYGAALEKHKERHKDKVQKWREALVQVGNILGEEYEGEQNIFIQKIVKLFREKLSAQFPECHLPLATNPDPQRMPQTDQVVLYTSEQVRIEHEMVKVITEQYTKMLKALLKQGDVEFTERNCSKNPEYMEELKNLVGKEKVKFPMLIVNGKDLCGAEEVEGLDWFRGKQKVKSALSSIYGAESMFMTIDNFKNTMSLRVKTSSNAFQRAISGNTTSTSSHRIGSYLHDPYNPYNPFQPYNG